MKSNGVRNRWLVLVAMTGSLSMILVDQTVVSVALPTMGSDLDMSGTALQWVINAYLLALAALVAVGGRVADAYGRVRFFVGGVLVFLAGSMGAGLAPDVTVMLSARVVQGIGAAVMVPASLAIVIDSFELRERGRAMAIYAGVSLCFLALGPLIGGALTEAVSWRWVFFVNAPVAVAAVVLTFVSRPAETKIPAKSLDPRGVILLVAGMVGLVLGLMQGNSWGWTSAATVGCLAGGLASLGLWVLAELRHRAPLVDVRLFANTAFSADVALLFCVQAAIMGVTVFGSIFLQDVLGYTPISTGLALLPLVLPLLAAAQVSGRMLDRRGVKTPAVAGSLLATAAFVWLFWAVRQESYGAMVAPLALMGIGLGLVMTPVNTDAMNRVHSEQRGLASGLLNTMRQLGGAMGLAIVGAVVASQVRSNIVRIAEGAGATPEQAEALSGAVGMTESGSGGQLSSAASEHPQVAEEVSRAVSDAIAAGYLVSAVVIGLGALIAIVWVPRGRQEMDPDAVAVAA